MDVARKAATRDQLAGAARAALGSARTLTDVARLRGGSKKGVYRLTLDDGSTAIAYIWDATENYWPTADEDHADPFSQASGIDLFEAAQRRLTALGVRTPQVHLIDRSRAHYPADIAIVEDIPGPTLEALLQDDPRSAGPALARLAESLDTLREACGPAFGKLALIDNGGTSHGSSCEQLVLDRALADLAEAAARDNRVATAAARLADTLRTLAAAVAPRTSYGLVHGELGPDHVLVGRDGEPVLIDIEGLMFFDVEWEHAFLRIRFREHYRPLHHGGLDPQRLDLYTLAMRLSLVAGPLRLLDGDFPHRAAMLEIAEHNLQQALAFTPSADLGQLPALVRTAVGRPLDHLGAHGE